MKAIRLGIAGLTHGHVKWIFRREPRGDIDLVGIYEPNPSIAQQFAQRYNLDSSIIFHDLEQMITETQPEGVVAFGSIHDHLAVVQTCAPQGVHVMVEKPLAISMVHAEEMATLAQQYGIYLLTNYETSWYASVETAYKMAHDEHQIGAIRKVVVHDGHRGPQDIGCSPEFLDWLTNPNLNGGGALMDFGCYGANLMTWFMDGASPKAVTAITQQLRPEKYPNVDDDATIILTYPNAQCIIQASWNWAISRKDMEIYGETGYIIAPDGRTIRMRQGDNSVEETLTLEARPDPFDDPFAYFAAVLRGDVVISGADLYGLANNLIVVQILDAARQSAQEGRTVTLRPRIRLTSD